MTVTLASIRITNGPTVSIEWDKHEAWRVRVTANFETTRSIRYANFEAAKRAFLRQANKHVSRDFGDFGIEDLLDQRRRRSDA